MRLLFFIITLVLTCTLSQARGREPAKISGALEVPPGCLENEGGTPASAPFHGKPHAIPGLIEAEHWDKGAPGVAYSDSTADNKGENYREETQVDIEKRPDASNGHGIGWVVAGEWLIYTVEVAESGKYRIEMPVASPKLGGLFRIEMSGKDVTGPIRLSNSGDWKKLVMLTHEGVLLEKGTYQMKVVMIENGETNGIGDIDYFKFVKS